MTYFGGFCYFNSHFIRKGTTLMFMNSVERWIQAFIGKLSDRCFCRFPAPILVPIRIGAILASPWKALLIWVNNLLKCFAYEKSHWPKSRRWSFYIILLSFLRFWNLPFYFYFWWLDSENLQLKQTCKWSEFGLQSYAWFWNRTSAHREFDLKSQAWFQTRIARHQVPLPLSYSHF